MDHPLVSVIALCYKHAAYVAEALHSIFNQTYANIEIIVVDDASQDDSVDIIKQTLRKSPFETKTVFLENNLGNCSAFNRGLALAQGKYIIDFATDDILLPNRIEQQVNYFESLPEEYGVIYSDAEYFSGTQHLGYAFKDQEKTPFSGDVFSKVIDTFFIPAPTMMIKKKILDELSGYDEKLAYEDFDFWVRSSRNYHFGYQNKVLTKIRDTPDSHSKSQYKKGDPQLFSTYLVCRKTLDLIQNKEEKKALINRLKFETRHAIFSDNRNEAKLFLDFLEEVDKHTVYSKTLRFANNIPFPLRHFRKLFLKVKHG